MVYRNSRWRHLADLTFALPDLSRKAGLGHMVVPELVNGKVEVGRTAALGPVIAAAYAPSPYPIPSADCDPLLFSFARCPSSA